MQSKIDIRVDHEQLFATSGFSVDIVLRSVCFAHHEGHEGHEGFR